MYQLYLNKKWESMLWGNRNIVYHDCVGGYNTIHSMFVETHWIIYLKSVKFLLCALDLYNIFFKV